MPWLMQGREGNMTGQERPAAPTSAAGGSEDISFRTPDARDEGPSERPPGGAGADEGPHRPALLAELQAENARLRGELVEALHASDELLAMTAHEIRVPLSTLLLQASLSLEMLRRSPGGLPREQIESSLRICERQARRIDALVARILDAVRLGSGRGDLAFEEVDLSEVVRDVADRLAAEVGQVGCRLILAADLSARGTWDRTRLAQIVSTLISSAARHGAGHPIHVSVEPLERTVRLVLTDGGTGVRSAEQPLEFDRCGRTAASPAFPQLGIELHIVRKILDALGGSLRAAVRPDGSASFVVELPRSRPAPG